MGDISFEDTRENELSKKRFVRLIPGNGNEPGTVKIS